jgi:hypothetical protein
MNSLMTIETDVGDIYRAAFADTTGEAFVVVSLKESIEQLVRVLNDLNTPPTIRLFASKDTLRAVKDDFIVASTTADLIADGTLSLRMTDNAGKSPLVVTEDAVISVVRAGKHVAGLGTDSEDFINSAREQYTGIWDTASGYDLQTPPLSRVRETMEEEFGPEVRADFDSVLASLDTAPGDVDGLDGVTISLLVAAKNEVLLYDISRWGENVGVASRATFSRIKTELEEMGLIDTEKVPTDVGRPRLRLLLGDERLVDADADELASAAQ